MIEKGTATLCRDQEQSYTTYQNGTIDLITDQGALAIYVYLQTKPSNWIIRAKDVQKHFGIGRDKYRSGMRILKDLGLVEYRTIHNSEGHFVDTRIVLHYKAIPIERQTRPSVENENESTERLNRQSAKPTVGKSTPLVIKDSLVIKEVQVTKTCASDDEPVDAVLKVTIGEVKTVFDVLWGKYHNKKQKKEAMTAFLKIVNKMTFFDLHIFVKKIQTSLESKNRENAIGWSNTLFASYLNGECWNDEVTSTQPVKQALDMAARFPATMKQFLSDVWRNVGAMDDETRVILQWGIENGKVNNPDNIDKLTQFGFTRGNE